MYADKFKIALLGNLYQEKKWSLVGELLGVFHRLGAEVLIPHTFSDFLIQRLGLSLDGCTLVADDAGLDADVVVCMGGDGTFLTASKMVMDSTIPLLGINHGRLGFLSDVAPSDLDTAISDLLTGQYRIIDVPLISLYANQQREPIGYAMNEFSVSKCDNSSMLTIDAYVDGDLLTTYWADGLIIATATGSTAYSLSVGGPIVYPTAPGIIITPIAPHNLTIRPLVLPTDVIITLHVNGRSPNIMTTLDGQTHLIDNGAHLRIAQSKKTVKRIQLRSYSFFATLRDKLLWGADQRNTNTRQNEQS